MNFLRLKNNIMDFIKEEQVKLGYNKEPIYLFYPAASLERLLGENLSLEELDIALNEFSNYIEEDLGPVKATHRKERYCLSFTEKATEYVHLNTPQDGFIYDFVNAVSKHGATIDDIFVCFKKASESAVLEKSPIPDFDYYIYFKNGQPDEYIYCLTDEGVHFIYHRFTKEDFAEFLE